MLLSTTECSSYRHISLFNIDLKLLAKILANRLRPLLAHVISPEQVGFVPGREAKDNIIKALLLTQASYSQHIKSLLLSTDVEKAFDFMFVTCTYIGLNSRMMAWITTLYQQPSARKKINGSLSDRALKCLGIWLTPKLSTLYEANSPPLLQKIEMDLKLWNAGCFSCFGRTAILKMVILPRLLYLLRPLPIKLPKKFFKKLHSELMILLWVHKKSKIKFVS